MDQMPQESGGRSQEAAQKQGGIPNHGNSREGDFPNRSDTVGLIQLVRIAWDGKWLILMVTGLFAIGSVAYALLATEWYRAEVLLAPADEISTPALGAQLGGLAALAGVTVGGGDGAEAVAVLKSRGFARSFIRDLDLMPILFADNLVKQGDDRQVSHETNDLDIRDAVELFHESVLKVAENRQTRLVKLAIEWRDPELAAEWAGVLVERLNAKLRDRALREAEANVDFLREELAQTSVLTLQQSIGRLLETELQKLMLARGSEEFAFRVIDSADVPKQRVRPKRALIAVSGTLFGGIVGMLLVLIFNIARSESAQDPRR